MPVALVTFAVVAAAFTPASGPFALALVPEPHLFIAALIALAPVAVLGSARTLALALVVTLVAGGFLFGSEWVSLPESGASRHDISRMTWNVQYGTRTPAEQAAQLEGATADPIALQDYEID